MNDQRKQELIEQQVQMAAEVAACLDDELDENDLYTGDLLDALASSGIRLALDPEGLASEAYQSDALDRVTSQFTL